MKPTFLRVSALSNWTACERMSAARLLRGEIMEAGYALRYLPTTIGAVAGTSLHTGVSVPLAEKARTGELPPRSVTLDAARDSLASQLESADVQFDGPFGPTHSVADVVKQVTSMAGAYHDHVAPTVQPILVETRLEAEIEPGFILSGQPDQICREPHRVRDLKSGARAPRSFAAQLGGYALLSRTHNHQIDTACIDFVKRIRKPPQPKPVTIEAPLAAAETAATAIIAVLLAASTPSVMVTPSGGFGPVTSGRSPPTQAAICAVRNIARPTRPTFAMSGSNMINFRSASPRTASLHSALRRRASLHAASQRSATASLRTTSLRSSTLHSAPHRSTPHFNATLFHQGE